MNNRAPDIYTPPNETTELPPDLQYVAAELVRYGALYPQERASAALGVANLIEAHQTQLYEGLRNPSTAPGIIPLINDSYRLTFRPNELDILEKQFYVNSLPAILSHLEHFDDPTAIADACEALRRAIAPIEPRKDPESGSPEKARQLADIDTLITFAANFMRKYPERSQKLPLETVYIYGTQEQKNTVTQLYLGLAAEENIDMARLGITMLPRIINYSTEEDRRTKVAPVIDILIARHGITPEVATKAWLTDQTERHYAETLADNLTAMQRLETARPGMKICETLYRDFGILAFADRHFDLLIRQFDQRDEPGPYILMTFGGYGTHSYSATHDTVKAQYEKITAQAESNGYHVRMSEARTKDGLKRLQQDMAKRYGAITHWNIYNHGNGKALVLSEGYAGDPLDGYVHTEDIPEVILADCLDPVPRINILSCFGGIDDGVAEAVHMHTGAVVLSPTRSGEMQTMDFLESEPGVFDWDITYQFGMNDVPVARFASAPAARKP